MSYLATNNQVRHMYVGTGTLESLTGLAPKAAKEKITAGDKGDLFYRAFENPSGFGKQLYFQYRSGDDGDVLRSDIIDVANITQLTLAKAENERRALRTVTLKFRETSHQPITGESYGFNLVFRQFLSRSDRDEYVRSASVIVPSDTFTQGEVLLVLAATIKASLIKDAWDFIDVYIGTVKITEEHIHALTGTYGVNDALEALVSEAGLPKTATSITFKEKVQKFERGVTEDKPLYFDIRPNDVVSNSFPYVWGEAKVADPTTATPYDGSNADAADCIPNGRNVASLEWATTAMRGDTEKDFNWPMNIKTDYVVDPNKEYDLVDIHFFKTLSQDSVQKSEKQLTIAVPKGSGETILGKIKTAASLGS